LNQPVAGGPDKAAVHASAVTVRSPKTAISFFAISQLSGSPLMINASMKF